MTSPTTEATAEVLAGGGVVLRRTKKGRVKVLVVHRPHREDWSLPKGKLDPGETLEDAAVREVEEETGVACRTVASLGDITYVDRNGRDKLVRYWLMEPAGSHALDRVPDDEVDEVRWVRVGDAPELLTYDTDRDLLARALEVHA